MGNAPGIYMDKVGGPHVDPEVVEHYFHSINHIGSIVKNNMYFKLIVLISLLDIDPMEEDGTMDREVMELVRLRLAFLKLMKRRMRTEHHKKDNVNLNFEEFEAALAQVKKISHFIAMLMGGPGGPPGGGPPGGPPGRGPPGGPPGSGPPTEALGAPGPSEAIEHYPDPDC